MNRATLVTLLSEAFGQDPIQSVLHHQESILMEH